MLLMHMQGAYQLFTGRVSVLLIHSATDVKEGHQSVPLVHSQSPCPSKWFKHRLPVSVRSLKRMYLSVPLVQSQTVCTYHWCTGELSAPLL